MDGLPCYTGRDREDRIQASVPFETPHMPYSYPCNPPYHSACQESQWLIVTAPSYISLSSLSSPKQC